MGWSSYLPSPIALNVGPVPVRWYGVLLALGVLAGYLITRRPWQEHKYPVAELEQLLFWLLISGLIGARLVDAFVFEWGYFSQHLGEVWYIWQGGLAWHGGLLGAGIVAGWWCRRHVRSLYELGDLLAPGLALGQAVGRWGNYFNQELFGLPTQLPWGIPIASENRPAAFVTAAHFHPTFLYESLGLLLIAWLLWHFRPFSWSVGRGFAIYLLAAGCLRFLLEFLRIDEQLTVWGVRVGFITAGLVIATGLFVWHRTKRAQVPSA